MKAFVRNFWMADEGQDLIEYSLLVAFVCLASAAILTNTGRTVLGIWDTTRTRLETAESAVP